MIKRETIKDSLVDFCEAYGRPKHIKEQSKMVELINIYHRELSKHYNDKTIHNAIAIAWTKSRGFPTVADFFEGYGGKDNSSSTIKVEDLNLA